MKKININAWVNSKSEKFQSRFLNTLAMIIFTEGIIFGLYIIPMIIELVEILI